MSAPGHAESAPCAAAVAAATSGAAPEAARVPAAPQPSAPGTILCANCGAPLGGKYCSECGQRHHDVPLHHFGHFLGEAFEDLTHADSRLWQTLLALLFRPGFLTREFLEGHRARYLPPVRLYLVVSVIFFLITGWHARISGPEAVVVTQSGRSFSYKVIPAGEASGPAASGRSPAGANAEAAGVRAPIAPTAPGLEGACRQTGTFIEQHGGWLASLGPRAARNCATVLTQSGGVERLNESITQNFERAMFLFLPLLALAMKPLYRKPPRHYVEHLLFFLHNHAFLFVVLGLKTVLEMITASPLVLAPVNWAIALYIVFYFYRAMRLLYGQGRWLTLSKFVALGVTYFFLAMVMLIATVSFSFLML
jgi:Protein of unknown function (DUF3667)